MNTPVALFIFNRPAHTRRVLDEVRKARPSELYIVADGPRPSVPSDTANCREAREVVSSGVTWDCVVHKNYATRNMGCAIRVSSGLDWCFSAREKLIILEDDCVPEVSFFSFCSELLERYKDCDNVAQICGTTRYWNGITRGTSYVFSKYGPIWGWASWRRAWQYYDITMKSWPQFKQRNNLRNVCETRREHRARERLYDALYKTKPSTWDFQWGYTKLSRGMLSIIPCNNLVENIGLGEEGTHIHTGERRLDRGSVKFPLLHPATVEHDSSFDQSYAREFTGGSLLKRALRRLSKGIAAFNKMHRLKHT